MADAALIGVDWGTSAFRAFLLDAAGAVLDRRSGPHGILTVEGGDFAGMLAAQIGDWLDRARLPVLTSGMIGSRQGWMEAPYVACPAGIADVAGQLLRAPSDQGDIRIVPGVETRNPTMRDVMRGEETQIFGALAALGIDAGRFLLPGTHSKWVRVEGGRIASFATYMTGEVYATARAHTILGRLMQDGDGSGTGFLRGVGDGARAGTPGALLNRLFGVRTAGLFGEIAGADLADYLSGLLIGAEIADAGVEDQVGGLHIIASDALAERYRAAAAELSMEATIVPSDSIAHGYAAIARMAGLLTLSQAE
jgi:2-dehydro-3-deoxygalactonokinase